MGNVKAIFVPCTVDGLSQHTGSVMIRARWVAKHWPGAVVYDGRQSFTGWDLVIFQKAYLLQTTRDMIGGLASLRDARGKPRLAFDLCDPDFLKDEHRRRMLDVLPLFDFAVAPTHPLVDWLAQYLPSYHIPDTVDLEIVKNRREFLYACKGASPRLLWIGYRENQAAIDPEMLQVIKDTGVEFEIVSVDRSMPFDQWLSNLTQYDVLLNPRPKHGTFRYKSNNKSLIAWASGVAVAETADELRALVSEDAACWIRNKLAEVNLSSSRSVHAAGAWVSVYRTYMEEIK